MVKWCCFQGFYLWRREKKNYLYKKRSRKKLLLSVLKNYFKIQIKTMITLEILFVCVVEKERERQKAQKLEANPGLEVIFSRQTELLVILFQNNGFASVMRFCFLCWYSKFKAKWGHWLQLVFCLCFGKVIRCVCVFKYFFSFQFVLFEREKTLDMGFLVKKNRINSIVQFCKLCRYWYSPSGIHYYKSFERNLRVKVTNLHLTDVEMNGLL